MSLYTRQTYELVASLLREPPIDGEHRRVMAAEFADKFAADNPRFDRQRFMSAALPPPDDPLGDWHGRNE